MKKLVAIQGRFRYTFVIGTTEFLVHAPVVSGRESLR